jgi:Leucine-rich repeat (LRR) protein
MLILVTEVTATYHLISLDNTTTRAHPITCIARNDSITSSPLFKFQPIITNITYSMMLHSLAEVMASKQPILGLVLRGSQDMMCTNLFCERVSEPCVCRLDRVLKMKKLSNVKILDLSNNNLDLLPPSIHALEHVEELNISGNKLCEIPDFVLTLPHLKVINVSGNAGIRLPVNSEQYKYEIITDAESSKSV